MNVLNIFCDASIDTINNGRKRGCAGCITVVNDEIQYQNTLVINNTTNNFSEITAILLGVFTALRERYKYDVINLFSDSKICIYGLREWIFNWVNNVHNGIMYGSSNDPVANQSVFAEIANMIYLNNLRINLYHQKGHVTSTAKSIENAIRVFYNSNGIEVDIDMIMKLSYYNNMIDTITGQILESTPYVEEESLNSPAFFDIKRVDFDAYKSLLNKKGDEFIYV